MVGDAHHLAVHDLWRFGNADVIAGAFAHSQVTIGAHQDGKGKTHLGAQAKCLHQLTTGQQVKELLCTADLHIGLEHHGVVALHQAVKELVQPDGLAFRVSVGKIVAGQELLHRKMRRQPDYIRKGERSQPLVIVVNDRFLRIQHTAHLLDISLGIGPRLLWCLLLASAVSIAGIANQGRKTAHQKDHLVAQFLKLHQLAQWHRVPQVQVRRGRIHAQVDTQWPSLGQSLAELASHRLSNLFIAKLGAAHQDGHLFIN